MKENIKLICIWTIIISVIIFLIIFSKITETKQNNYIEYIQIYEEIPEKEFKSNYKHYKQKLDDYYKQINKE